MTGFDSLVDELMACHGYDRDEAELIAEARLAAGDMAGSGTESQKGVRPDEGTGENGFDNRTYASPPRSPSPAASFACDPCECGGLCDECEEAR